MMTHIRKYVPGVYYKLVTDWGSLNRWEDNEYWMDHMADEYIEGFHYMAE